MTGSWRGLSIEKRRAENSLLPMRRNRFLLRRARGVGLGKGRLLGHSNVLIVVAAMTFGHVAFAR